MNLNLFFPVSFVLLLIGEIFLICIHGFARDYFQLVVSMVSGIFVVFLLFDWATRTEFKE